MLQPRQCGACTLCCTVIAVEELGKAQGVDCQHSIPGKGCAIHRSPLRPRACGRFECQWLIQRQMPDSFRPDLTGVVLTAIDSPPRLLAVCDEADALAWRREPIYSFLKRQTRSQLIAPITVLARSGPRLWLLTATTDLDLGEVSADSVLQVVTADDGTVTVSVQPPAPPP